MNLIPLKTSFKDIIQRISRQHVNPVKSNYVCLTTVLSRKHDEFGFNERDASDDTADNIEGDRRK
ncbi:MAG: hypothetical protein J0665_16445 [Deltaproteobacteria bacterium]|nr:hypothetical protein [Deltaproteobacteria bacterium]